MKELVSYLCDHHKADEEASNTDRKQKEFTSVSDLEEGGIQVWNRCHESLQTYKLEHTHTHM